MMIVRTVIVLTLLSLFAGSAMASSPRDSILNTLAGQAKGEDSTFSGFSAERGKQLYFSQHKGETADITSCTSCHTNDPTKPGQTRAGKVIDPMAVSGSPERFTDAAKVEKWFGRNCKSVLGRPCTTTEKGDFITYMSGL